MQIKEVKVKLRDEDKEYSFDCSNVFIRMGDKVVVDTALGEAVGVIVSKVSFLESEQPIKKILRIATSDDLVRNEDLGKREKEIKNACTIYANELNLDMRISKVTLVLDGTKAVISYTSVDRVDFRELVKKLAFDFKIKIEMKQIDARGETKIIGGLGPCGRECCCSLFLSEVEHSSIKMAKIQGLSLNPTNTSGLCGKLKCCIAYENDHYAETFSKMPKVGTMVDTPDGKGTVIYNNLLREIVSVKFVNDDGVQKICEYALDKIKSKGI